MGLPRYRQHGDQQDSRQREFADGGGMDQAGGGPSNTFRGLDYAITDANRKSQLMIDHCFPSFSRSIGIWVKPR